MDQIRDTFLEWLRDAHAAEKQALTLLGQQANRIDTYPALRARIEQHITETEGQVAALDQLLERYGAGSSVVKDITGRALAFAQGMGGMMASDEVVKAGLFSYAFEHMEIASYRILIATAAKLGDQAAVNTLSRILAEEEAMAEWLADNLDAVVEAYLTRLAIDQPAKR